MLSIKTFASMFVVAAASFVLYGTAIAGEDCSNGPVRVDPAQRVQFTVPPGQAVRLTFTVRALWENMIFVCDALTGQQILVRGNGTRSRDDWISPIDNTRSLAYSIVAFHKTVSQGYKKAGSKPWFLSPLVENQGLDIPGDGKAHVQYYGFSDGGGDKPGTNALITAYTIGTVGEKPGPLPKAATMKIQSLMVH